MDLYEALKNGTSVNKLEDTFRNELKEAVMRLEEERAEEAKAKEAERVKAEEVKIRMEKAKTRIEEIKKSRSNLTEAMAQYVKTCVGETEDSGLSHLIELLLKGIEKDMNIKDSNEPSMSDDDIILTFIRELE